MMFIINIIPDCFSEMLRGSIKGLGIQSKILIPHILIQGLLGLVLTWFFGFFLEQGLIGIWIAKTIQVFLLNIVYIWILYNTDWFEIAQKSYKRENPKERLHSFKEV